jgi:hypothetical protein
VAIYWTKPYHGVQHATVNGQQATVTDYGSFAVATIFPRVGAPGFFSAPERPFDTAVQARAWVASQQQ